MLSVVVVSLRSASCVEKSRKSCARYTVVACVYAYAPVQRRSLLLPFGYTCFIMISSKVFVSELCFVSPKIGENRVHATLLLHACLSICVRPKTSCIFVHPVWHTSTHWLLAQLQALPFLCVRPAGNSRDNHLHATLWFQTYMRVHGYIHVAYSHTQHEYMSEHVCLSNSSASMRVSAICFVA